MKHLSTFLILGLSALPAHASGLKFSPEATEACLASTTYQDEYRFCVGHAADACMEASLGGHSTVGMGGCLDLERQYWDDRLNTAYQALSLASQQTDAATAEESSLPVASQAEALRDMQRAWIGFRDAACGYEYSLWGGGTGGGPAITGCLMLETGWQALRLEARLIQFESR